jgi:hypothetical protein
MNKTKRFTIRILLTVTTGRLLTEGPDDNGISDLYDILGWMTGDAPFTHQLGRFAEECKPWLLRWFPELTPCGVNRSLEDLDRWLGADQIEGGEAIRMWLRELKVMFPNLKDGYDVPRIPQDDHEKKDPYDELVAMRGTDV